MIRGIKVGVLLVGVAVGGTALAARPAKSTTPSVPVIADATGAIVGPVVPVVDGTMALAAVYRSNGERIKILFDALQTSAGYGEATRLYIAATSTLRIRGPVELWFPNAFDCTGTGYVQDTDIFEPVGTSFVWKSVITKEYKGYSPLFVYPKGPESNSAGARLVRVDWNQPTSLPGFQAFRLTRSGVCRDDGTTTHQGGTLFPVTFEGEVDFTGPYSVQ